MVRRARSRRASPPRAGGRKRQSTRSPPHATSSNPSPSPTRSTPEAATSSARESNVDA